MKSNGGRQTPRVSNGRTERGWPRADRTRATYVRTPPSEAPPRPLPRIERLGTALDMIDT